MKSEGLARLLPIDRRSTDLFPGGDGFSTIFKHLGGALAVIGVTMMVAVAEPGPEFSEIAGPDSLPA
jgi:hypothetical protein